MRRSQFLTFGCLVLLLSSLPAADERELVVVSWNVLADASERERRLPVLLTTLRDARPDILAVQETTTWFSTALAVEPWAKDLRRVECDPERPFPGGLALFTRLPVVRGTVIDLPSAMGRCGLGVEVMVGQTALCIGVVHLDSHLEDGPMRRRQMQAMNEVLQPYDHSLLVGDFNFADGDPEEREVLPGCIDAWNLLHPGKPGFTWDIERSPMARRGSFPNEPSRRLDRVLVKSMLWRPTMMTLLGTEPVAGTDGQVFPSDHFGVRVVLNSP